PKVAKRRGIRGRRSTKKPAPGGKRTQTMRAIHAKTDGRGVAKKQPKPARTDATKPPTRINRSAPKRAAKTPSKQAPPKFVPAVATRRAIRGKRSATTPTIRGKRSETTQAIHVKTHVRSVAKKQTIHARRGVAKRPKPAR